MDRILNSIYVQRLYISNMLKSYQRCSLKRMCSSDRKNTIPDLKRIRNFSIVAHVDHGKSTLADRLLELTGVIKPGAKHAQVLDKLQVERERGITVKAVTASLDYTYNEEPYLLNLIDTPGHVDFSNEVVRSVTACQGVILLVDANEGVQAQTVAVYSLAKRNNLVIIPTLNKVDLPRADPEKVKLQLKSVFGIEPDTVLSISAKKGWGVEELLEAVIKRIPPPAVPPAVGHFKAKVIDTWHDKYRGVLCLVYIYSGKVQLGQAVKWRSDSKQQLVKHLALLRPDEEPIQEAVAGQVVMVGCGPKGGGSVGDQLVSIDCEESGDVAPMAPVRHMVYAGVFPADQSQHMLLSDAIKKLALNDSAVSVMPDSSPALGQGWRIGFLGLLHLDVFTQRLLQEYKAEAILTAPSVPYKIKMVNTRGSSRRNMEGNQQEKQQDADADPPAQEQVAGVSELQDCKQTSQKSEQNIFARRPPSCKSKSTSSTVARKKKQLYLLAEKEKARIKMELIDKKLEADLAELDEEYSSLQSHRTNKVEKWLDRSLEQPNVAQPPPDDNIPGGSHSKSTHADVPAPFPAPAPMATYAGADSNTVEMLARAVQDLAAAFTSHNNNGNLLSRLSTPRDLPEFSGDPLEYLRFKQAYDESTALCGFTPRENLWRLRKCLRGPAKKAVSAMLNFNSQRHQMLYCRH